MPHPTVPGGHMPGEVMLVRVSRAGAVNPSLSSAPCDIHREANQGKDFEVAKGPQFHEVDSDVLQLSQRARTSEAISRPALAASGGKSRRVNPETRFGSSPPVRIEES